MGSVGQNTEYGIFGNLINFTNLNIDTEEIEVASRNEIKTGDAKIIINLENGVRKEYNIKIEKIFKNNNSNNKSMQIKVTDENLLELTGGIVQRNERSTNSTKRQIRTVQ